MKCVFSIIFGNAYLFRQKVRRLPKPLELSLFKVISQDNFECLSLNNTVFFKDLLVSVVHDLECNSTAGHSIIN